MKIDIGKLVLWLLVGIGAFAVSSFFLGSGLFAFVIAIVVLVVVAGITS